MGNDEKKTYRLYALPLTSENIALAAENRFSRATPSPEPGYVLVYTNGDAVKGAVEIGENNANRLSNADIRWLMDSSAAIMAEEIEKNKPEVIRHLSESVEALEDALQRKKEEIDRKGD